MPQPPAQVPDMSDHIPSDLGGGAMGIDDDQAAIARAVEESMRQAHN